MKIHLEVELTVPYREEPAKVVEWAEKLLKAESRGGWYIIDYVVHTMILPSASEMDAVRRGEL
jgi:hypothetical protein